MRFGYARVSSLGQSLEIQFELLNKAVVERIVSEKASAANLEGREELRGLLAILRPGDEIFITKLDRLARSVQDLIKIVNLIEERQASLHVIQQPIETKTSAGRLFLIILGAFAAFENEIRRERQSEGIAKAKAAHKYKGTVRGPSYDRAVIYDLFHTRNMTPRQIGKKLGCAEWTARRAIKEVEKKLKEGAEGAAAAQEPA